MIKYPSIIFLFLFHVPLLVSGQGENNVWIFGRGTGLDFNVNPPVQVNSQILAREGTAAVSDAAGNLLFYGTAHYSPIGPGFVWNRLHQVMPNGSGMMGNFNSSSYDGAVIVPDLDDTNKYYLFVVDEVEAGPSNYLWYSVIDMSLDNGLGDIVPGRKNVLLDSFIIERMFATQGAGCYNWLVALRFHPVNGPELLSYKIDNMGIHPPVVSPTNIGNRGLGGDMKIAPDNRTVALLSQDFLWGVGYISSNIHFFDFDPVSGSLVPRIVWDSVEAVGLNSVQRVAFSPNNQMIYVSGAASGLIQYDISLLPDLAAVRATKYVLFDTTLINGLAGAIRLGPDGKIYNAQNRLWPQLETLIGCIHNPDVPGPGCNYDPYFYTNPLPQVDAYTLGLGTHVPVRERPIDTFIYRTDTALCLIAPVLYPAPAGYTEYVWNDGSTDTVLSLTAPGRYWVRASSYCEVRIDTFQVARIPEDTIHYTKDTTVCFGASAILTPPPATGDCLWNTGETNCVRQVNQSEIVWLYRTDGCMTRIDTFRIQFADFSIDLGNDTTICGSDSLLLDVSVPITGAAYTWQDAATGPAYVVRTPGLYAVTVQVDHCMATDTLMVHPGDTLTRMQDTVVCFAPSATLTAASGYDHYLWHQGSTTSFLEVQAPQTAWVYATRNCSTVLDSFIVDFIRFAADIGNDTVLCAGSFVLDAAPAGAQYLWHNGVTDPQLTVSAPGVYSVSVSIGPCTDHDTVRIKYEPVLSPTMDDRHICHGRAAMLDASTPGATAYLWDDQSAEPVRVVREAGVYYVQISNAHCMAIDTVVVTSEYCDCPVFIPSAFTPNGDGRNDLFGPVIGCPPSDYRLMIYNRYGEQIFISNDVLMKWDGYYNGALQGAATFYYHLQFTGNDGFEYSRKGDVVLLR